MTTCLYTFYAGEAVPEEEFVKISLRDISTANIAAEEMGGASETATPSLSRQSSVANSVNSDTPTHSTTSLPSLHNATPPDNSNHVIIENLVNGEIPSSSARPIHELKHSNNNSVSNLSSSPRSEDIVLLEKEREKLYVALDEKVCAVYLIVCVCVCTCVHVPVYTCTCIVDIIMSISGNFILYYVC